MTYLLTPPTRAVRRGEHPLFGRMSFRRGVSLLKEGGFYRQVIEPADEDIAAAEAAYIGGHEYLVSDAVAAELVAAGYGENLQWVPPDVVVPPPVDPEDPTPSPRLFGSGLYGAGIYPGGGVL